MRHFRYALLGLLALAALFFGSGRRKCHALSPVPEPVKRRLWQVDSRDRGAQAARIALLAVLGLVLVSLATVRAEGTSALQPIEDPSTMGEWSAPIPWPVAGVHAALMPTGKVLHYSYPHAGQGAEAWLWDPQSDTMKEVPVGRNLFCGGHAFLPDGRLLVAGGTDPQSPSPPPYGIKDVHTFDPATEVWEYIGDTQVGRWYPTNVTLPDGRILILSGIDEQGELTDLVEVYDPTSGIQVVPGANRFLNLYPWMHVLPSGRVLHAGPSGFTSEFDPATATWQAVAFNNYGNRQDGASVLLPLQPPDYLPKVLALGGGEPATATVEVIDLGGPTPAWSYTAPMNHARHHADPVLLPDGKLLVVGGTSVGNDEAQAVLAAESFDPASATWTELASMQRPRIYHSTAILLPDGRVLAAGTDGEFSAEIYSPPYLFQGPRPAISSAPEAVAYGSSFQVPTANAAEIGKVVLVRPAAMTHSVNMGQRLVELDFQAGSNVLTVGSPPSGNLAPPGYYMMFIISSAGVPSEATFIRLGATIDSDGDGTPDSEDPDVDGDGYWDDDEIAKGSDPFDGGSTPEHCDGVDNDGDTTVDEPPAGSGRPTPDSLCDPGADPDGDTIPNSADLDDDGDGWSDVAEQFLSTDELDDCPDNSGHDALAPDFDKNTKVNIIDALFYGPVILTSFGDANYGRRLDLNANGSINIIDVLMFSPVILQDCDAL